MSEQPGSDGRPPRVFVSYSDDSAAHAKRVLALAQWLRSHGVDAHIDQFEESPEEGWPRWVYTQIREAQYVLVIATPGYLRRCEGEVARAVGADPAVKFESHLSLQELHEAGGRNRKFIPVLFDDDAIVESVPLPLRGATCYRLPAQREDLYRRLTGQPKVRRAPLGVLKTFDDESLLESTEDYARGRETLTTRGRAALHEQKAEDSLRAVIDAGVLGGDDDDDEPAVAPRWRRSWFQANRQRLIGGAAFGAAFVLVLGVFVVLNRGEDEPNCKIQLTDPSGSIIEGIDHVEIEMPSGHRLEVTIQDGNTLSFACPESPTQAQAHVYLAMAGGEGEPEQPHATVSDTSGRSGLLVHGRVQLPGKGGPDMLESVSSEGIPRLPFVPVRVQPTPAASEPQPESPEPTTNAPPGTLEPDPPAGDGDPDETVETDEGQRNGAGTGDQTGGRSRAGSTSSPPKPKVSPSTKSPILDGHLRKRKTALTRCYEAALAQDPTLRGELVSEVRIDPTGEVTRVDVVRDGLGDSGKVADCVSRELRGLELGSSYTKAVSIERVTIEFAPR